MRVDKEGSLTSLTLQDCGTVLPGGMPYCSHVVMFDPCLLCTYLEDGNMLGFFKPPFERLLKHLSL